MNIYVSNLADSTTEDDMRALFARYGSVESVHLMKDTQTNMSQGSAYVVMADEMEAEQAIAGLNGSEYDGQFLRVSRADSGDFPTGDYW